MDNKHATDLRFFEVMNKIGDAARDHGDLESVNNVIQAIMLYMDVSRGVPVQPTQEVVE
jgi:hypothetical protein